MNNRHQSAAALVAACLSPPARALTEPIDPPTETDAEIVVTGTRVSKPTRSDQNGGAITVLDADALDRWQTRAVSDILRDVPGVAVSRIAGQTQLRPRGTKANQKLVLVDGTEVSDSFSGAFDFGTLAADEAGRVEVLRGQQGSIYGSDAIGGVNQYIAPTGREAPGYGARIEVGSFGALDAAARVAGVSGDFGYVLSGTIDTTDGTGNGATDDLAFTDPSYVRVRLRDYALVNRNADLRLTDRLSPFGRVENLLDQHYEDVFSFTNTGVSAYAGVRARF